MFMPSKSLSDYLCKGQICLPAAYFTSPFGCLICITNVTNWVWFFSCLGHPWSSPSFLYFSYIPPPNLIANLFYHHYTQSNFFLLLLWLPFLLSSLSKLFFQQDDLQFPTWCACFFLCLIVHLQSSGKCKNDSFPHKSDHIDSLLKALQSPPFHPRKAFQWPTRHCEFWLTNSSTLCPIGLFLTQFPPSHSVTLLIFEHVQQAPTMVLLYMNFSLPWVLLCIFAQISFS